MALFKKFSLHKRSNGVWYVLYYNNGRQRWKSTGATTKPEALRALTNLKDSFEERLKSLSFEQFSVQFLANTDLAAGSLERYRFIFKKFVPFLRGAFVNEITAETIDAYKSKRLREVSPVTVNIELRMLKAAFGTAKRWKMTAINPFADVSFARVAEMAPLSLNSYEFEKLFAVIREGWFRELVQVAVLTGLRRGELLNLRWSDVDLPGRLLTVETNPTWKTKNGRRRVIPLNETAALVLKSRFGKSASEYVFTLNDAMLSQSRVSHTFKRYVREAKLENSRLRFHSLRHTFATWLTQSGVPIHEVQKLLGHSSVRVTEIYSHLVAGELHTAVNKIKLTLN